ncbi:GrpE protein 1, mitochondrial [Rhizophlyctis rosea]|nr:GrpE protein 1, mitochondrial [Rhizophlyctis rosea]
MSAIRSLVFSVRPALSSSIGRARPSLIPAASRSSLPPQSLFLSRRLYSTEEQKQEQPPAGEAKTEGQPAGEQAATEAKEGDVLAEKEKQITELKDLYRRSLAEAENVRQRAKREVEQTAQYAVQRFAKDLLESADVLQIALNAVPEAERSSASNKTLTNLYEGVSMTRTNLLRTFKRFGIEPYEPVGEKFDPNLHEALFYQPAEGKEPGTISAVVKIGYKLQDRVLRPAQVGVVKGPE